MRNCILFLLVCFFVCDSFSQIKIIGSWEGVARTSSGVQYVRLFFDKKEKKKYYGTLFDSNFKDGSFCYSKFIAGILNKHKNTLLIEGLEMINFRNTSEYKHSLSLLLVEPVSKDLIKAKIVKVGSYLELLDTLNDKNTFFLKKINSKTKILSKNKQEKRYNINLTSEPPYIKYIKRDNKLFDNIKLYDSVAYLRFYDHGQIDNDTISIYLNEKQIITNHYLDMYTKSCLIEIKLNKSIINKLVLVAESIGILHPNTATLEILDSKKKNIKTLILESDLFTNACINFYF